MSTGVMIALLPITDEWCKIELPHMTLVYAGDVEDHENYEGAFNDMAKDAAMLALLSNPITLRVKGKEVFGGEGEDRVDVLRLQPTAELIAMRRAVQRWNKSEWEFKPHVTIGPEGSFIEFIPRFISFEKIHVAFGDESLTFLMRR